MERPNLYTGPLTVAAILPHQGAPGVVILVGLAYDINELSKGRHRRVRLEITPEDAEDLVRDLQLMIRSAKGG